ncbi:TPR Domain containing protein [Candidatus Burkholderia pumila]|uniref:TPR Domain containing protein n=1 Tax=Candidatus Burkholderia pumila TaxID=1090375 RepID=A0ABR5HM49_9BURK|nr:TPR Domain containing protein [Candidatus Burkholderia pumila]
MLRTEPRHPDALHLLGLILAARQRGGKGKALVRQALQVRESPVYLSNLGNLLFGHGAFDEACAVLQRAIELDPGFASAHFNFNLGNVLHEPRRYDEAMICYERALERNPAMHAAMANLGGALNGAGRVTEAEAAYLRAIDMHPAGADYWYNLDLICAKFQSRGAGRHVLSAHHRACARAHRMDERSGYRAALARSPEFGTGCTGISRNCCYPVVRILRHGRTRSIAMRLRAPVSPQETPTGRQSARLDTASRLKANRCCCVPNKASAISSSSCASSLKALGAARITSLCPPPLVPLMEMADDVDEVISSTSQLKSYDYWLYAQSAPLYLNTRYNSREAALPACIAGTCGAPASAFARV